MVVHESGAAYVSPGMLAQSIFGKSRTIRLQPWARVEGTLRMGGKAAADEQVTLDLAGEEAGMPSLDFDYKTKRTARGDLSLSAWCRGVGTYRVGRRRGSKGECRG